MFQKILLPLAGILTILASFTATADGPEEAPFDYTTSIYLESEFQHGGIYGYTTEMENTGSGWNDVDDLRSYNKEPLSTSTDVFGDETYSSPIYILVSNFTDVCYTTGRAVPIEDSDDWGITHIELVVIGYYYERFYEGNFSYSTDYPLEDSVEVGNPQAYGNWTYSENYSYTETAFDTRIWDITNDTDWSFDIIYSHNFTVVWTSESNESLISFDYLGITIEFIYTGDFDDLFPDVELDTNALIAAVLWLSAIFAPAIILGRFVPKLGFAIGLIVTLLVLSILQSGFFPILIMGMIGIGVLMYKESG